MAGSEDRIPNSQEKEASDFQTFFKNYSDKIEKIISKHTYAELTVRSKWLVKEIFDEIVMPHSEDKSDIAQQIAIYSIDELSARLNKYSPLQELNEMEIRFIYSSALEDARFYVLQIESALAIIWDKYNVHNIHRNDLRSNIKKYIEDARGFGKDVGQSEETTRAITRLFIQILRENKKIVENDVIFDDKMLEALVRQAFFLAEEAWTFKQRDSARLIHAYIDATLQLIHDPKKSFVFLRSTETESILETYLLAAQAVFKSQGFLVDETFLTYFSDQLNKRLDLFENTNKGPVLDVEQLHKVIAPVLWVALKICTADMDVFARHVSAHLTGIARKMFEPHIIYMLERDHLKLIQYKTYIDNDSSQHLLFSATNDKDKLEDVVNTEPKDDSSNTCVIL